MSLPGPLRNLRQYGPTVISALLLCLFGVYLAGQIRTWLDLDRAPLAPTSSSVTETSTLPDPQQLDVLFGSSPAPESAAPTSAAGLTLHGSFVHADPARSSAIIQFDGQPPQLVWQGQELQSGMSLHSVHPDHIQILHNGRLETLRFPAVRSTRFVQEDAPEPAYEPAGDAGTEEMQQQMEALRQQLEGAASPPPQTNESAKEDD